MPLTAVGSFARRLAPLFVLRDDDLDALAILQRPARTIPSGVELTREAESSPHCFFVASGWVACYKLLEDGGRQIINFALPGDLVGLRSVLFDSPDCSVATLTETRIVELSPARLLEVLDHRPRLGAALLWIISRDDAIIVQHLVNVGRRDAAQRVAHLLLELAQRTGDQGDDIAGNYDCPLTQLDLADALGLTAIHVNRVLRMLRQRGLVTFSRRRVVIHDVAALRRFADFDERYLNLRQSAS